MLKRELAELKQQIERHIEDSVEITECPQRVVYESMKYSLMAGGKRIRPILFLKMCSAMGGCDLGRAMDFALAIEMIHTYSLIHDDLPAMDNDDFRRGKPTNHKVYGEDIAILAGDGLLNLAYEKMIEVAMAAEDKVRYMKAMNVMAKASGVEGMIGGQVADIISERSHMDENLLYYIHENKTSKLIEASLLAGAIIGGAAESELEIVSDYGRAIGNLFQIRDDILDKIGDSEKLGKSTGIDERNEKLTYVSLFGLEESIRITENLADKAVSCLDLMEGKDTEFFKELARYLVCREV